MLDNPGVMGAKMEARITFISPLMTRSAPTINKMPMIFQNNLVPPLVPIYFSAQSIRPKFCTIHSLYLTMRKPKIIAMEQRIYFIRA